MARLALAVLIVLVALPGWAVALLVIIGYPLLIGLAMATLEELERPDGR